jgi:hypothetical protein
MISRKSPVLLVPLLLYTVARGEASADKPVIAVFNVEDRTGKLSERERRQLTDYLTSKVAEGGMFLVVPSDRVRERLRRQKVESYKECYDQRCQIELGRELAAKKSLSTRITRLGSACIVTAVLFDLRKAASEQAASMEGPCTIEGLVKSIESVVNKLGRPRQPEAGKRPVLKGGLLIKSTPTGAEVWVDGVRQPGVTPLTLSKLTADAHLLVVRKGQHQYRAMVQVKPDEFTTVNAALRQVGGRLSVITTPPEARVLLDGREAGQTPTIIRGLSPGAHALEIRKEGFVTERRTIKLATATAEQSVELGLRRAGTLMVVSSPAGATLLLDGQRVGHTPYTADVAPGSHSIHLELRGRRTVTRKVAVVAGQTQGLSVQLELSDEEQQRQAAFLQVRTETLARRRNKSIWAYSSLGVGLGLAATAGILYGVGVSQGNEAHDNYMAVDTPDQAAMDRYYDDVETAGNMLTAGHVLMGASAVALSWAIYEFVTRPDLPEEPRNDGGGSTVGVAPLQGGAAFTLRGCWR